MLVRDEFQCEAQADSMLRGHSTMRTYSIIGPATVAATATSATARTR